MKTITKKAFKLLHSSGKLLLLDTVYGKDKDFVFDAVSRCDGHNWQGSPVSRIDVGDIGEYQKQSIYTFQHEDHTFYVLEVVIDNSKCRTCSMTNIETDCILYLLDQLKGETLHKKDCMMLSIAESPHCTCGLDS